MDGSGLLGTLQALWQGYGPIISSTAVWAAIAGGILKLLLDRKLEEHKSALSREATKELESHKSELARDLAKDQAAWQGDVRKEVEEYLGQQASERTYVLDARKRLYSSIGPLRFQLLMACRDATTRFENLARSDSFSLTMRGYYGRTTLYRLLRPVALAELVERQITYADFSVDTSSIDLLLFRKAAFLSFTDAAPIVGHPGAVWSHEVEHLFSGTLHRLANRLIVDDSDAITRERPMYLHEFEEYVGKTGNLDQFRPLTTLLEDFAITNKPIFWLRLISFAYVCNELIAKSGGSIGFERRELDVRKLLAASNDQYTLANVERYEAFLKSLATLKL